MKKTIRNLSNYLRELIINIFQTIRNPGLFLSKLIYFVFGSNKSNIPYPLLLFVIKHLGPWAGVSIVLPIRLYSYKLKLKKLRNLVFYIFLPLIIIALIIIGAIQDYNNFLFGFDQNLLAEIIFILLALYILPKLLNKPKKYNISLERKEIYNNNDYEEKTEILISIRNTGEEVYKHEEIYLEIFVPLICLEKEDISMANGDMEVSEVVHLPMWRLYFLNKFPLFLDQEQSIVRLKFRNETLYGSQYSPFKIYYIFRTINGNIPTFERITRDFQGGGIPFEEYPKLGELVFTEYNNPEHFSL
jgi:hypothetical protein